MPKGLKRISRVALRDQVLDSIRKAIISGKFKASEEDSGRRPGDTVGS